MSISEGVRTAIERSGVSRYVLARVAKVNEAALSRFAAGKSGLSSESLDRVAEALGLELIFTVAKTPRPTARGRRPTREATVETQVELDWQALARHYARDAHDNHFESRRGVWLLEDRDRKAVVYNNNPYTDPTRRPAETESLREAMKADGFTEIAYAEYGDADQPGYTYAMVVDLGGGRRASRHQRLVELYREVTLTTLTE